MKANTLRRLLQKQGFELLDQVWAEDDVDDFFVVEESVELGFPYYIIKSVSQADGVESFMVLDKYFHYVWSTATMKNHALRNAYKMYKQRPEPRDMYEALMLVSDSDIFAAVCIKKQQDLEGYIEMYKETRGCLPPKDNKWLYNELLREGHCVKFAPGCIYYLLDEQEILDYLDSVKRRKKIKHMVRDARRQSILDLIQEYR